MTLSAVKYSRGSLSMLDQLRLPEKTVYMSICNVEEAWNAISKMQVRGAPAIAIVGCLSLAVELHNGNITDKNNMTIEVNSKLDYLITSRPTAVNLKQAADDLKSFLENLNSDESIKLDDMKEEFIKKIENMLTKDLNDNKAIGKFGSEVILNASPGRNVKILTHCNTGSLATSGYGTALGVVRSLHAENRLDHCYCTETRPYNQGARLTAYELVHENIPATLIVDSMVAALMKHQNISAVVVGADRIASNGDTANKIGTYQIAVVARYHSVPFYIAAPFTSIDLSIPSGNAIKIEERPENEMTHIGGYRIAAEGIKCWNPSFDVTPASLITGIITEKGVYRPEDLKYIK